MEKRMRAWKMAAAVKKTVDGKDTASRVHEPLLKALERLPTQAEVEDVRLERGIDPVLLRKKWRWEFVSYVNGVSDLVATEWMDLK